MGTDDACAVQARLHEARSGIANKLAASPKLRATAFVAAVVVVIPGLWFGGPAGADARSGEVVSAQPTVPTEAPDEATAAKLARRWGRPIENLAARSETAQTFAQPDGTFRTRQSAVPQRVRRGGTWTPIDTTLTRGSDGIVPTATTLDMRFSAGGSGPMLVVTKTGGSLSLSWPKPLPAPSLSGDTATYPEVLPGVDLRLAAAADSVSEVLVVKTAEAAKNPDLTRLRFGLALRGVSMQQDATTGFIRAVDTAGVTLFASDGARMWDSPEPATGLSAQARGASAGAAGAGEPARTETVPVQLAADSLTVLPSQDMLSHPDTNFPLYIDPGFSGGSEIWTHVSRQSPNTSYWSDSNRDEMRSGQAWHSSSTDDWRTLTQFNVEKLKGSTILSAKVMVVVEHSADCTPSPLQLWRTSAFSQASPVTWNNTKDKSWVGLDEEMATANKSSCPKGNDEVRFDNANVLKSFQDYASAGYALMPLVFRAKSESDEYQWKKLKAGSTYLDINYNKKPAKPTGIAFSPCNTTTCKAPVFSSLAQPKLTMAVSDPDGGTLRYEYEVYDYSKTKLMLKSGASVTGVKAGTALPWTLPKKLANGEYNWRGRGCDAYLCGEWWGWGNFHIDSTNPVKPEVTSPLYSKTIWSGGPGVEADFTFAPGATGDTVKQYQWALNDDDYTTSQAGADGKFTKRIAPSKDFINTLTVTALDAAGNTASTAFPFLVQPIGAVWNWGFEDATGIVATSAPLNNQPATLRGSGVRWSESGYAGSAGSAWFTGAADSDVRTDAPVLRTAEPQGFTVAAAVYLGPEPPTAPEGEIPPAGPDFPGDDPDVEQSPSDTPAPQTPTVALPTVNQTAVTQDGTNGSMFRLGYRADLDLDKDGKADPAWCFTVFGTDTANAAQAAPLSACSTQFVNTDGWVHLTGQADPLAAGGTGEIRLYVNGTPAVSGAEAVVPGKALWASNGKFAIGRGWTGNTSDRWNGGIDDVYAVPRIWGSTEINMRARQP